MSHHSKLFMSDSDQQIKQHKRREEKKKLSWKQRIQTGHD